MARGLYQDWAASPEGIELLKELESDESISNEQGMAIINERASEFNAKRQEQVQNMDPNVLLGTMAKKAFDKDTSPETLKAINASIEDMGIYNEVSSNIKAKEKKLQPPKGQKVVDVPVDVSRSWSYLADDLKKLYDYDVEQDWDQPLMKFYNDVQTYKVEVGDMTESSKKDFVYNFLESDFYQKHLQQFMKDNPGMNYKYADFVMSNMFTKLLLVGAKGVMKPASFDDFGAPKSWKIDRFSIPMMSSEYMKMVDEYGESVNKNDDISRFEKDLIGQ